MEYFFESGSGYVLILNEGFWFGSRGEKATMDYLSINDVLTSLIMGQLTISKSWNYILLNVLGSAGFVLDLLGN